MKTITKIKTSYYSKEILKSLLMGGAIAFACSDPYFVLKLTKNILNCKKFHKKKALNSFDYLRKKGLIEIKKNKHNINISLTEKGKKMAGKYQINDLKIDTPKKWDKKWRVIIFDIPDNKRLKRNIFRDKIKEFGFYALQKSVWVFPYECEEEVELLREFLGLKKNDIQVIIANRIDNEKSLKKFFKL